MKYLPKEPTPEMVKAWCANCHAWDLDAYKAMHQAAPEFEQEQEVAIQKLLEENIKLDTDLIHDSEIITSQAKRIVWLEYMIAMGHFIYNHRDIDLWKEQTKSVYEAVSDRMKYSDTPPIFKEEWYK